MINGNPRSVFVPDHTCKCINCSQTPCVTLVTDGKIDNEWCLCGPCTFGTAKALDPSKWNGGLD